VWGLLADTGYIELIIDIVDDSLNKNQTIEMLFGLFVRFGNLPLFLIRILRNVRFVDSEYLNRCFSHGYCSL